MISGSSGPAAHISSHALAAGCYPVHDLWGPYYKRSFGVPYLMRDLHFLIDKGDPEIAELFGGDWDEYIRKFGQWPYATDATAEQIAFHEKWSGASVSVEERLNRCAEKVQWHSNMKLKLSLAFMMTPKLNWPTVSEF